MNKNRLEAFSDGVFAIIITIMVLELKVPHGSDLATLAPLWPVFLSYAMSFVFVAIYWSNHHHLFQAAKQVNGIILWANSHLLFWLSLVPFVTGWMGENHFAAMPVAAYGVVLLCCGGAYKVLTMALLRHHGNHSLLAMALGSDFKGTASLVIYVTAVAVAAYASWLSCALYGVVSVMWLVPDSRIEKRLDQ